MTMHAVNLHERLADSSLRSCLLGHAKRSLSPADAEDVVQQTLCDAMSAHRRPAQDAEVAPWLMTILKRRICDWFRSPRTERFEESDPARGHDANRGAGFDRAVDARDMLERVVAHVSAPDRDTLRWLVEEHDGDTLETIAARDRCAGPVVRQRIHRFRQRLRARWLLAATLSLVLWGAIAAHRREAIIVRDDMALAPVALAEATGLYEIDETSVGPGLSRADRALLDGLQLGHARVRVSRPRGEPDTIVVDVSGVLLRIVTANDGRMRVRASDGSEHVVRVARRVARDPSAASPATVEIFCEEGRLRGAWLRLRLLSTE